jgi:hypothetical protein
MERLPFLGIDDEEGLLLLRVDSCDIESLRPSPDDPANLLIPFASISEIFALTHRATRLLEPRLAELGIRISHPHFNRNARIKWYQRGLDRALRGGDALLSVLVEDGESSISPALREAIAGAIWALDHESDQSDGLDCPVDMDRTCIGGAFLYARQDPPTHSGFDFLNDLGVMLRKDMGAHEVLDGDNGYKALFAKLRQECGKSAELHQILSHSMFQDYEARAHSEYLGLFRATPGALIQFLAWRDEFQRQGTKIDISRLSAGVARAVTAIGFDGAAQALWLLGCFAGHESVARIVYAAGGPAYRWYSGPPLRVSRATRPSQKPPGSLSESTAEQVASGDGDVLHAPEADTPVGVSAPETGLSGTPEGEKASRAATRPLIASSDPESEPPELPEVPEQPELPEPPQANAYSPAADGLPSLSGHYPEGPAADPLRVAVPATPDFFAAGESDPVALSGSTYDENMDSSPYVNDRVPSSSISEPESVAVSVGPAPAGKSRKRRKSPKAAPIEAQVTSAVTDDFPEIGRTSQ